jgi:hypothetical protein
MDFLTENGLQEPGLFRVPGNNDEIEAIKRRYQNEEEVKLVDVNDTAGVFKQYLRKLPEPLIPYDQYKAFMRVAAEHKPQTPKRCEQLRELLGTLPKHSFALLRHLCVFLVRVATNSAVNKMTSDNIAIVFAPNLLRPKEETATSMMVEMPLSIGVINTFIDQFDDIFGVLAQQQAASEHSGSSFEPHSPVDPQTDSADGLDQDSTDEPRG